MKIVEFVTEITKPVGTIYLRFKEKMGDVPPNATTKQKQDAMYLIAFAGFANSPDELTYAGSKLKFHKLKNMEDIVKMVKSIMGDKVFVSAKTMTLYVDFSNSMFKRHPYLGKFLDWVQDKGGDKIKVEFKPDDEGGEEGPKKKAKPNPMLGKKIRDVDAAEPKFTVTFSVGDRFYREIERNMPNMMKYRGPGRTFVMKDELFRQFRSMAKDKFPDADIKVVKRVATEDATVTEGTMSKQDFVDLMRDITDPDYIDYGDDIGVSDPDELVAMARKQYGDKFADELEGVAGSHWPKKNRSRGNDNLKWRQVRTADKRITQSGKMHGQDVKSLKGLMKSDPATNFPRPSLPESDDLRRLAGIPIVEDKKGK